MSRLKRRKIIKKPSYYATKSTFELEIEKIVIKEGFPNPKSFVLNYINKGYSILGLQRYLAEKYGLEVSEGFFYNKIRKLVPSTYNRHTRGHYKRRAIATEKGHLRSENHLIKTLFLKGQGKLEIAKTFKTRSFILTRNKNIYPFDFSGNESFPDKVKLGMKRFKNYYRWLQNARKIGFESVVEAIEYLLSEKKLSMRDTAWIFQVTEWRLRVRISKCLYLREKLNLFK